MAVMPYCEPIAIMGVTAANVQPCMSGRRTPNRQKPIDWITVAIPATNRSALIRYGRSEGSSLPCETSAPPTIKGTATAPAYMASTCCRPSGASRASGGIWSTGCFAVSSDTAVAVVMGGEVTGGVFRRPAAGVSPA